MMEKNRSAPCVLEYLPRKTGDSRPTEPEFGIIKTHLGVVIQCHISPCPHIDCRCGVL